MNEKNSENRIWVKLKNIQNDFFKKKNQNLKNYPKRLTKIKKSKILKSYKEAENLQISEKIYCC